MDPNISTGIPSIDAEHEVQLGLMEEFERAVTAGRPPEDLKVALGRLVDYLEGHFLSEQIVMRENAYPGYEDHVQDHDQAIALLQDLRRRADAGSMDVTLTVLQALRGWLISHIAGRDKALGAYLLERGMSH